MHKASLTYEEGGRENTIYRVCGDPLVYVLTRMLNITSLAYEEGEGVDPSYRCCEDPRVFVVTIAIIQQDLVVDQNLSYAHSICILVHVGTECYVVTIY